MPPKTKISCSIKPWLRNTRESISNRHDINFYKPSNTNVKTSNFKYKSNCCACSIPKISTKMPCVSTKNTKKSNDSIMNIYNNSKKIPEITCFFKNRDNSKSNENYTNNYSLMRINDRSNHIISK